MLSLTPGVDYILEFDYWADTNGNGFHVDLVTPDWNYVFAGHKQGTKTPQHAQFTINSSSPFINNVNLRFFYNSGAGNNVGNVYISNVRLYNKAAAESGWYLDTGSAIKISDFKGFSNSSKTTVVPPGRIKATEALSIKPINHAVASTNVAPLKQNTEYILEFDYWGDMEGDIIITDLYPDNLPESFFLVSTSVKRARISISSNSPNMTASSLRFFVNTGYGYTNRGNVYAANILFYEKGSVGKAPVDPNPFRYAGEYFDNETGTYYLRARNYRPRTGRFTQQDTYWNTHNMVYGDNPVKLHDYKNPLGLNLYTYKPNIETIRQNSNLYIYCLNNPVYYVDVNGYFVWPGELHQAVQYDIIYGSPYGVSGATLSSLMGGPSPCGRVLTSEIKIKYGELAQAHTGKKSGRADIVDVNTGELWEIKSDYSGTGLFDALSNIEYYTMEGNAYTGMKASSEGINGKTPFAGGVIPGNIFNYTATGIPFETYVVSYWYADSGVINYNYYKYTTAEGYAKALVAAVLALLAAQSGELSPQPAF